MGVTYEDNRRLYKIENKTTNYLGALEKLDLEQLSVRREMLTKKFAVQSIKSERHRVMFQPKMCIVNTRNKPSLDVKTYKKHRTHMSAIPYMTRTLNDVKQMDSKKKVINKKKK